MVQNVTWLHHFFEDFEGLISSSLMNLRQEVAFAFRSANDPVTALSDSLDFSFVLLLHSNKQRTGVFQSTKYDGIVDLC